MIFLAHCGVCAAQDPKVLVLTLMASVAVIQIGRAVMR